MPLPPFRRWQGCGLYLIIATNSTHNEISRYNSCIKVYPHGRIKTTTFNYPVYNPHGLHSVKCKRDIYSKTHNITRNDSLKRAKDKIYDISSLNNFTHFVTLTLDSSKIDRYDYSVICKKLKKWLNNMSNRYDLVYIIVPELHKDGAVHFHGLIKGNYKLVFSGKSYKGKEIYNLDNWHYGFTTCVELDNNIDSIAYYICKYITKDTKKILGNIYYAGGKGLIRDVDKYYNLVDYKKALGTEYEISNTLLKVKYYEMRSEHEKY